MTCLPIVIDIVTHVDRVWTMDSETCWEQASSQLLMRKQLLDNLDKVNLLDEGLFILFQLKKDINVMNTYDNEEITSISNIPNPLTQSLGHIGLSHTCQYIAIYVDAGSREMSTVSKVLNEWRHTFRAYDIPEYKGGRDVALPTAFLKSYVIAMDSNAFSMNVKFNNSFKDPSSILGFVSANPMDIIGYGYSQLRYVIYVLYL